MNCTEFRERHPLVDEAGRSHLASCADCRGFAAAWDLLKEYPAIAASPGFGRALRRRLAPAILRFAAPLAAAAAALLLAVFLSRAPAPSGPAAAAVTEEERELVENLEILQNYDLLQTLELVGENGSPLVEEKK